MIGRLRKIVTGTNVAVVIALVLAMSGGAYAANKILITSTKQISAKVLKQLKGKTGVAGQPGAKGETGAQGAKGDPGQPGKEGAPGKEGKEGKEGLQGKEGKEGKEGLEGQEGSPWTAGGTLPSGKTEKGTWGFNVVTTTNGAFVTAPISFTIPLASALDASHVFYVTEAEIEAKTGPAACAGTIAEPTAEKGTLCVYERFSSGLSATFTPRPTPPSGLFSPSSPAGAGVSGSIVFARPELEVGSFGWGSWAVTAA